MTNFKHILAALFLGSAMLTLPACSTISNALHQPAVATLDEKALITSEIAYSFVLQTTLDATQAGAISPAEARQVLPVLQAAQAAATKARAAYDAGNSLDGAIATQDLIGQIAAVTNLLEQFGVLHRNPAPAA